MFFVPEKYKFASDLCVKEWSQVLQSTFLYPSYRQIIWIAALA